MSFLFLGYYVESSRPETVKLTVEEMAAHMKRELQDGCDGSSIKCGVIGEVGCSWPLLRKLLDEYFILDLSIKCITRMIKCVWFLNINHREKINC